MKKLNWSFQRGKSLGIVAHLIGQEKFLVVIAYISKWSTFGLDYNAAVGEIV